MAQFEENGLIVAVIDCKPGKGQGVKKPLDNFHGRTSQVDAMQLLKIIDLYTDFIKTIKPREPDCTHFVLYRQIDSESGVERLYTVEKFKSVEVIPFHRANPALEIFNQRVAEMDILAKPIEVATCTPVVGHKWL